MDKYKFIRNRALIAILFLGVPDANAQKVDIKFKIDGLLDSVAYVGYHFGAQKYILDTLAVKNGEFRLVADQPETGIYFIYSPGSGYSLEFVMDKGAYSISASKAGGHAGMRVENSKENEIFRDFQLLMEPVQSEQRHKIDRLKQVSGRDSVYLVNSIQSLERKKRGIRKRVISQNPGSFVSSFLKLFDEAGLQLPERARGLPERERKLYAYNYYHSRFFAPGELSDGRLLRTPVIHSKVMKYLDQVIFQHPDTVVRHVDKILSEAGKDPELFRYWLVTLFEKYGKSEIMGMDAVMIHLLEKYYLRGRASWITEEYEKRLREEVAYVKPNLIGAAAPPVNVVDRRMRPVTLNDILAEHVLLIFYDPNCGHCKKAMNKLKEMGRRYAEAGVEIFAVCTTTDVEGWKSFIQSSDPSWIHAIDPSGKDNFRVYYNTRSVPQVYLVDEDKKIIAKKIDVAQFIEIVEERIR